jgi:hypothetical protein
LVMVKRWWPFFILLVPTILILLWYIDRTWVNTVWLDGFNLVPLIGRFLDSKWSLGDLFGRFGEHLLAGYAILSLINAKFLSLDMRLDPVMFLIASSVIAAIVYTDCSRIFKTVSSTKLGLIFLPLGLLSFSLVAPPFMLMSTQFAWGAAIALLIAWFLQQDLGMTPIDVSHSRWWFIGMLIMIPIYFFFLSGAYFPGLVFGLGAMYFCRVIITKNWFMRHMIPLALVIATCIILYFWYIFWTSELYSGQGSFLNHLVQYFTDISDTLLSYIAGIGSSIVDQHTLEQIPGGNGIGILILGGVMAFIAVISLWLFFKTRMYEKTYLPIYCIFYSLGIITSVRFGRGIIGNWAWLTNEWYSFHYRLLAIGVVWILVYTLIQYLKQIRINLVNPVKIKSIQAGFALLAFIFIFDCQAFANLAQWYRGPYIHNWLVEKRNALMFPELFDNPADIVLWPINELSEGRAILEKNKLSCFSPQGLTDVFSNSRDGILRISGWYDDNWISGKGSAVLNAQIEGDVSFEGFVPEFIPRNYVEVHLNNEIIFAGALAGGEKTSFSYHLQKGINFIVVTCDKQVIPASIGGNPDQRPLAFHLLIQSQSLSGAP